jgi:hypothetical protein
MPSQSNSPLAESDIPSGLMIDIKTPRHIPFGDESLEFHAARLLLILRYVGGREFKLTGRTKLAKLDFFVRYPSYLIKAATLLGTTTDLAPEVRAESPMIRYKYGPWDARFYDVFALLVGKQLMDVIPTESGDTFRLTDRGRAATEELEGPEFQEIIERIRLVNRLFGGKSGAWIKNFIYEKFPEIVARPLGEEIEQ